MEKDELNDFQQDIDGLFVENGSSVHPPAAPAAPPELPGLAGLGRPKRIRKAGFRETLMRSSFFVAVTAVAALAFYLYFTANEEAVALEAPVAEQPATQSAVVLDSTPQQPVAQPEEETLPAATDPPPEGEFGVQVAICYSSACVTEFQDLLHRHNLTSLVQELPGTWESVEVYSQTTFYDRQPAESLSNSINREYRVGGQAYVRSDNNQFRISLGNFTDAARASAVRDTLNILLQGQVAFATRTWKVPYKPKVVVAGSFATRQDAQAARNRLAQTDPQFGDAFVVRR